MLTREEAENQYGNVPCRFVSYYKFSFSFTGAADDGAEVSLSFGGNAEDIYRYAVQSDTVEKMEGAYSVNIVKDGETIFKHYDP